MAIWEVQKFSGPFSGLPYGSMDPICVIFWSLDAQFWHLGGPFWRCRGPQGHPRGYLWAQTSIFMDLGWICDPPWIHFGITLVTFSLFEVPRWEMGLQVQLFDDLGVEIQSESNGCMCLNHSKYCVV